MSPQLTSLLFTLRIYSSLCISLDVAEYNTNYITTLKTFAGEEDVVNHVPRHERDGKIFDEHTKIENMELGVSVWKGAGEPRCFFRQMMQYETPPLLVSIAQDLEKRKVQINAANITQVILWATPERELTEEERDNLSLAMQLLCDSLPILVMSTEVVTREEFYQRLGQSQDCFYSQSGLFGGRRKRAAPRRSHPKCDWCASCFEYPSGSIRYKRQACSRRRRRSVGKPQ